MRLVRFGPRTTNRDRPVGMGRVRVNPSPGLLGIGVVWWIYTLGGLKASADLNMLDYELFEFAKQIAASRIASLK